MGFFWSNDKYLTTDVWVYDLISGERESHQETTESYTTCVLYGHDDSVTKPSIDINQFSTGTDLTSSFEVVTYDSDGEIAPYQPVDITMTSGTLTYNNLSRTDTISIKTGSDGRTHFTYQEGASNTNIVGWVDGQIIGNFPYIRGSLGSESGAEALEIMDSKYWSTASMDGYKTSKAEGYGLTVWKSGQSQSINIYQKEFVGKNFSAVINLSHQNTSTANRYSGAVSFMLQQRSKTATDDLLGSEDRPTLPGSLDYNTDKKSLIFNFDRVVSGGEKKLYLSVLHNYSPTKQGYYLDNEYIGDLAGRETYWIDYTDSDKTVRIYASQEVAPKDKPTTPVKVISGIDFSSDGNSAGMDLEQPYYLQISAFAQRSKGRFSVANIQFGAWN